MSVLVYRFGLLPPTINEGLVREQMRKAHIYRNVLVQIERGRRAAERALISACGDVGALELAAADACAAEIAAARAVSESRAASRKRNETKDLRDALSRTREAHTQAVRALAAYRKDVRSNPAIVAGRDALGEQTAELRRNARKYCGVYWGTYLLIEDEMNASCKMPLFDGARPNDPRFARWTGDASVGIQVQGGIPCTDAFGADTQIWIDPVDERAWLNEVRRGDRRRASRTLLRMRVGSEKNKKPIWAAWPMVMHRPFPPGGVIKRAAVHVRALAGTTNRGAGTVRREEWYVTITVELPEAADAPRVRLCGTGAVAIDVGWRQIDGELRVALWRGEDGQTGELRLSARDLGGLRKADDLRSIRDRSFNEARVELVTWLRDHDDIVPNWLREATETLVQWKSPARLAALALRWRNERFAGDESGFGRAATREEIQHRMAGVGLEGWRHHDKHLWCWEDAQRTGALRHRREIYRRFAADLSTKYQDLVLEKFDLRVMAKRPLPGGEAENEIARSNRFVAALGDLRQCLTNAFLVRGGAKHEMPAQNTTRTCNVCGLVEQFDAAAMIHHQCSGCGEVWDQDDNAAINLLTLWFGVQNPVVARDEKKPGEPEVPESRWVRARRLSAEKGARTGKAVETAASEANSTA